MECGRHPDPSLADDCTLQHCAVVVVIFPGDEGDADQAKTDEQPDDGTAVPGFLLASILDCEDE